MRLPFMPARNIPAAAVAALMLVPLAGAATAVAATHMGHAGPRRVAPPASLAHAPAGHAPAGHGRAGESATTTANPMTLDPPVQSPSTRPVVVTIANKAAFGNGTPPVTNTVKLPSGHWAQVVLDVTGTESGRQFDRLCEIFAGPSEIFLGVTPEPTPAGITWHVRKDITGYLPLLTGTQTFATSVDNFLSSVDTGIPVITAKLLFYPAGNGFWPAQPASLSAPALAGDAINETGPAAAPQHAGVPTDVVPVLPQGDTTTLNTVNTGQTLTATVTLPDKRHHGHPRPLRRRADQRRVLVEPGAGVPRDRGDHRRQASGSGVAISLRLHRRGQPAHLAPAHRRAHYGHPVLPAGPDAVRRDARRHPHDRPHRGEQQRVLARGRQPAAHQRRPGHDRCGDHGHAHVPHHLACDHDQRARVVQQPGHQRVRRRQLQDLRGRHPGRPHLDRHDPPATPVR